MFDASSLTTQFMVLCLGASVLSLLPLHQWHQWLTGADRTANLPLPPPSPDIIRIQDHNSPSFPPSQVQAPSTPAADPSPTPPTHSKIATSLAMADAMAELIVDLSDRTLYWYIDNELYKSYPIAIGQAGWETPRGIFHVLYKKKNPSWQHPIIPNHIIPPGPDNPLGAAWIGFFVDGNQQIGFHGTFDETAIGQAVSHGCIRLRNADILELYESVEVGWVVRVRS